MWIQGKPPGGRFDLKSNDFGLSLLGALGHLRLGGTTLIQLSFKALAYATLLFEIWACSTAWGFGCMGKICRSNHANNLIECTGKFCGEYRSERRDGHLFEGVDVECAPEDDVYAPFDGELYFWRPYGNHEKYRCADEGVRIEGSGQWRGYHVHIKSVSLHFFGGHVKKGDLIGTAVDHRCIYADDDGEPYLRVQLFKSGKPIDPTYHLKECMCTGQICESNHRNVFLGEPFKQDSRYNGVCGWEIKCPKIQGDNDEDLSPGEVTHMMIEFKESRAPRIYSPIDAEMIGRVRLYAIQGVYTGCDNDGVLLVGTGDWHGFEVLLYNARHRKNLIGRQRVMQGQYIADRLDCEDSPDSIFMEARYRGTVVNITDLISARSCKMPEFSPR